MPSPTDSDPCGSKSTRSTFRPYSASAAPRLIVVVVLPTPPFWLHIETTRAGPWWATGSGSGMSIIGRPVGPIGRSTAATAAGAGTGRRPGSSWDRWSRWATGTGPESSTSSSLPGYPALIERPPGRLPRDSVALDVDRYICRGDPRDSMHRETRSQRHRAGEVEARRIWGLRVCSSGGESTGKVPDVDEPVHVAALRSS